MQNDALVAQMEGMSHEEQQQFLAQQVTEQVSLPTVSPCHIKVHLMSYSVLCPVYSLLKSFKALNCIQISSSLRACSRVPEHASMSNALARDINAS